MQNWQPRPSPVGHPSIWPSTETRDKVASTSRQHGGEGVLSKMLPKLSHMDLTGRVSNKSAVMQAYGGYCDVFVGNIASEHVRRRCVMPTRVGKVKVAIKRLRVRLRKDKKLAKSLAREMGIWSKLNHRNILPLLGYLLEEDYPSLISEWIENGTTRDFLKNNPECDITHLALGIAEGLKYIHDQGVVHSDLKADNVLISQSGEPLICDFGISRMLNSSGTFLVSTTHDGSIKGSTRWMAIELYTPDGGADPKHTKETDVWAYGMTLYEMMSKQVPFAHLKQDVQVLFAIVKGELPIRPTIDAQSLLLPLWLTCESCWKTDPKDRFTMAQITWELVVLERLPKVQHRTEAASCQAGQTNFPSNEQDDRRRPNDMSLSPLAHDKFVAMLQDWRKRNGIKPDARTITIGNCQIDMHPLHTKVLECGGAVNVRRHNLWNDIAMRMGWTPTRINEAGRTQEQVAEQFKVMYEQLLEPFEVEYMAAPTKQPLSSQVPQDAGQQGGPSKPGTGSNVRSRPHEQISAQMHVHGLNSERSEPTHQAYPPPLPVHLMQAQQQQVEQALHACSGSAQKLQVRRSTFGPGWAVAPRVLLVDDDAVCRKLSSEFLQEFSCIIDVAVDGVVAVNKMKVEKYDLVLMDIVMPKLDGVSATTLIRQFNRTTPIVLMTKTNEITAYYNHGTNDILPKPFTKEDLLSMLEKHLTHLKPMQQLAKVPRSVGVPPLSDSQLDQALMVTAVNPPPPDEDGEKVIPPSGVGLSDEEYVATPQGTVNGETFQTWNPNFNLTERRTLDDSSDGRDGKRGRFEVIE